MKRKKKKKQKKKEENKKHLGSGHNKLFRVVFSWCTPARHQLLLPPLNRLTKATAF